MGEGGLAHLTALIAQGLAVVLIERVAAVAACKHVQRQRLEIRAGHRRDDLDCGENSTDSRENGRGLNPVVNAVCARLVIELAGEEVDPAALGDIDIARGHALVGHMRVDHAANRTARALMEGKLQRVGRAGFEQVAHIHIGDEPAARPLVDNQLAVHPKAHAVVHDAADVAVLGGRELALEDRREVVRIHAGCGRIVAPVKVDVADLCRCDRGAGHNAGARHGSRIVVGNRQPLREPRRGNHVVTLAVSRPERCDQKAVAQQVFGVVRRLGRVIVEIEAARDRQPGLIRLVPECVEQRQEVVAHVHIVPDDGLRCRSIPTAVRQLVDLLGIVGGRVDAEDGRQCAVLHPAGVHRIRLLRGAHEAAEVGRHVGRCARRGHRDHIGQLTAELQRLAGNVARPLNAVAMPDDRGAIVDLAVFHPLSVCHEEDALVARVVLQDVVVHDLAEGGRHNALIG